VAHLTSLQCSVLLEVPCYFLGVAFTVVLSGQAVGGTTISAGRRLVYRLCSYLLSAAAHAQLVRSSLGAFVLGILAGQSRRFSREAGHTGNYWLPIFFATAGLKVNLLQMLVPQTLMIGLLVLAVACFGKFTGLTSVPAQVA